MPPITKKTMERAITIIQSFRKKLNHSYEADRILDGSLHELIPHFLQRGMSSSYCYDLDFIVVGFENKNIIPRAVIEIKKENKKLTANQREVYLQIAKALQVPAYLLVFFDRTKFQLFNLETKNSLGFFNYKELTQWFKKLSKG